MSHIERQGSWLPVWAAFGQLQGEVVFLEDAPGGVCAEAAGMDAIGHAACC